MNKQIINAPKGAKYLGEFMTSLPVNCLFDKGRTGCGGTELAIRNEKDTIIVMPYISLITNKTSQHGSDVLGVYNEIKEDEIVEYINQSKKKKILVTYDSLNRLIEIMQKEGIPVFDRYFLLVDEYHALLTDYVFHNQKVKDLLEQAQNFKEVTYMSVIPFQEEFIPEELKVLPIQQLKWENMEKIIVDSVFTDDPIILAGAIIEDSLVGEIDGNLHFFVNSVDTILKIMKRVNIMALKGPILTNENVRVICSKSSKRESGYMTGHMKLEQWDIKIAETTDPVKKINFYTSTSFEGCDINDPEGRTYVVSEGNKSEALLDISTRLIQICGRIRDSKYGNEVTHIFNETRYEYDMTPEKYREMCHYRLKEAENLIKEINIMPEKQRALMIALIEANKTGLNGHYIFNCDNYLVLDKNLIEVDIMNFKISRCFYKSRGIRKRRNEKSELPPENYASLFDTEDLFTYIKTTILYQDLFHQYVDIIEENDRSRISSYILPISEQEANLVEVIENIDPWIKNVCDVLGWVGIQELNYDIRDINKEFQKIKNSAFEDKLHQIGIPKRVEIVSHSITKVNNIYYDLEKNIRKEKRRNIRIYSYKINFYIKNNIQKNASYFTSSD